MQRDAEPNHSPTPHGRRYPQAGLVYSEKGSLSEILCKPKLMPIKSATLIAMENKEKEMLAQVSHFGQCFSLSLPPCQLVYVREIGNGWADD